MRILTVQEDVSERQRIKSVREQIKAQENRISAQSVVSHEASCNIFDCPALTGKQVFCFKPQPDRIVE